MNDESNDGPMSYEELVFHLGRVHGALTLTRNWNQMVESLRASDLNPGYIVAFRDDLTRLLREAGKGHTMTDRKAQVDAARDECIDAFRSISAWGGARSQRVIDAIEALAALATAPPAPPAPVLTDERIVEIARAVDSDACDQSQTTAFARAIEADVLASLAP